MDSVMIGTILLTHTESWVKKQATQRYPELLILLPQHLECWGYRYVPPCQALFGVRQTFLRSLGRWELRAIRVPLLPSVDITVCILGYSDTIQTSQS